MFSDNNGACCHWNFVSCTGSEAQKYFGLHYVNSMHEKQNINQRAFHSGGGFLPTSENDR